MNPSNVALYGHRSQLILKHETSGSEVVVDRVQNVEPSFTTNAEPYYEIGRVGRIGITQGPPEFSISASQNLTDNMELEYLLSGQVPSPAISQNVTLGQIVRQAGNFTAYVLNRNNDDSILNEQQYDSVSAVEISYNFTANGTITQDFRFIGTQGKLRPAAQVVHSTWGTLDDTSFGGIHGKDARIWFTSGSGTTDRSYRLQSFTLRISFPFQFVKEIGNRANAGTIADSPDVTVDFDLLVGDDQPTASFYQLISNLYDYQNPTAVFDTYIRVFNPDQTEGAGSNVIKMFKIDNVRAVSHTPIRAQVRGLATARYSLMMTKEDVADSGGVTISNRNIL